MKLSKSALEEKLGTATRFKMHGRSYLLAHSSNFQPTSPDAMELFQIFDNDDEEVIVKGRKLLLLFHPATSLLAAFLSILLVSYF